MKRITLAILFCVVLTNTVHAQTGDICLFGNADGTQCPIADVIPGLLSVYVIHSQTPGATRVGFAAPMPNCMVGATYLSDSNQFPVTIGTSQTGLEVQYGACLVGQVHVTTMHFFSLGTTLPDCAYAVGDHPFLGRIEVDDCNNNTVTGNGGVAFINSSLSCNCGGAVFDPLLGVIPQILNFGPTANTRTFAVTNIGGGTLTWSLSENVPWLDLSTTSGVGDQVVTVTVDRQGLDPGGYSALVNVASNGGSEAINILMEVPPLPTPILSVSPSSLTFSPARLSNTIGITNAGVGTLNWMVSADRPWLEITPPTSSSGDATVTINVDPNLVPTGGTQTGNIDVSSNGGSRTVIVQYIPSPQSTSGLGVYADIDGVNCNIVDAPGLVVAHVVHTMTTGATASQFAATVPNCANMTFLADTPDFSILVGNSQSGIAIAYGACLTTPIHVLTINYFGTGTTTQCCAYPVLADPVSASGFIEVVDCASNLTTASGISAFVSTNGNCGCGTVATEESTWGGIKAMYAPEQNKVRR